jgi:Zn-dependent M16 (insulinase) family peptidase
MFGVNNISICKPEELLKLKYSDLVKFYKEIFTISNLTLLNHGDMNNQNILKNWNEII